MKKYFFILLFITCLLIILSNINFASNTINVKDYIKDKLPTIFSFYLSSLEELDSKETEFLDLLIELTEQEQEYYAKEVYIHGFSQDLLNAAKEGKSIKRPVLTLNRKEANYETVEEKDKEFSVKNEEKIFENIPSIINKIKPSIVVIYTFDDNGEFLSLGSGFFINKKGDIITNYHVLQGANYAQIRTSNGQSYPITNIVTADERNDITRLSVDISPQLVYPLSLNKSIPEVGEKIIVYGSPLGLENTDSDGIVSAIRDIPEIGRIIQITAPISPGSSGSPVFNIRGEVIGIATFQLSQGQNLNFAIPCERLMEVILYEENKTDTFEKIIELPLDTKSAAYEQYIDAARKGTDFFFNEEYEKALYQFEIASKIATKSSIQQGLAAIYRIIGSCNEILGFDTEAIEAYKQALYYDPNFGDIYYDLGICYSRLNLHEEAIEAYKKYIQFYPDDEDAYSHLGSVYEKLNLYEEAIRVYKQYIIRNPDDAYMHNKLGEAYENCWLLKEAAEAYRQSIRIDSKNPYTYIYLGRVYIKLFRFEEAIEALKLSIKLRPENYHAYQYLGCAYHYLWLFEEAMEAYQQAIRINPAPILISPNKDSIIYDNSVYNNLGIVYSMLGLSKEAIEAYQQAIRINPDDTDAHYFLGKQYIEIGEIDLALKQYKILKELQELNPDPIIDLANSLFDLIFK